MGRQPHIKRLLARFANEADIRMLGNDALDIETVCEIKQSQLLVGIDDWCEQAYENQANHADKMATDLSCVLFCHDFFVPVCLDRISVFQRDSCTIGRKLPVRFG
ncbi:hypothetical protein RRSWK_03849 [Rhodopirellula sp. SWK7]|nr:hypothetical protein RRSWK_03849 [Rhodopirellula sp. SWK7]